MEEKDSSKKNEIVLYKNKKNIVEFSTPDAEKNLMKRIKNHLISCKSFNL